MLISKREHPSREDFQVGHIHDDECMASIHRFLNLHMHDTLEELGYGHIDNADLDKEFGRGFNA